MPFLTIAGNAVPCAVEAGAAIDIEETGDRMRMFDASMMETVRARKQIVPLSTPAVTRSLAETYKGYLVASPPVSCSGDLFNNVATSCFVKYQGMTAVAVPGGVKWRVRFTLMEA